MSNTEFCQVPPGTPNFEAIVESYSLVRTLNKVLQPELVAFGGTGAVLAVTLNAPAQIENLTIFCGTPRVRSIVETVFEISGLEWYAGSGLSSVVVSSDTLHIKLKCGAEMEVFFSSMSEDVLAQTTELGEIRVASPEVFTASVLFEFASNPTARGAYAIICLYELYSTSNLMTDTVQVMFKNFIGQGYDNGLDAKLNKLFKYPIEELPGMDLRKVVRAFKDILSDQSNSGSCASEGFSLQPDEIERLRCVLQECDTKESRVDLNRRVCRGLFEVFGEIYDIIGPEVYLLKSPADFLITEINLCVSDRFGDSVYCSTIRQSLREEGIEVSVHQTSSGFQIEYHTEDRVVDFIDVHIERNTEPRSEGLPKGLGFSRPLYGEPVMDILPRLGKRLIKDPRAYDVIVWVELLERYPSLQSLCRSTLQQVYRTVLKSIEDFKVAIHTSAQHDERILPSLDIDDVCNTFIWLGSTVKDIELDEELTELF